MSWNRFSEPCRLTIKYAVLAGIWIVSSDFVLGQFSDGARSSTTSNIVKGLIFVAVTCAVLYFLAVRMQDRIRTAKDANQEDLRHANERLQRAKGMHAALARANQAALTATEEDTLCKEISEAMVSLTGLRLVWFGWVNEITHQVTPANWAGAAQGYLDNFRCSIDENDPNGRGPIGRAIRQSDTIISKDVLNDPSLEPWRDQIHRHGIRSIISMPLTFGSRRGSMSAYASEPDFFDAEIIELVQRLVADLQHGLSLIVARAERAQMDQELRENEARHHALFESNHVAMLLINPRDGTVIDATPAAARILGVSSTDLLHQSLRETPSWSDHGLLAAADRADKNDRQEILHTTFKSPAGHLVQLCATFSPFRFRNEHCLLCTLEDVSEKHQAIERLRLMQTALEAAPSGIVIADALGRIEWVNAAFTTMTGYSLDQVAGCSPSILKSGRQPPLFYQQLWNTISRGKIWAGNLQNHRRDGSIYWEHMVIAPVIRPNGTIEHYVAIKQDISAQKEMESQVARTQRMESIGLLASGIAHDLNNVLAPILMAMDLFKLHYPDPADQARFDMVRKAAERGAGIVRQVLTFARGVDGERMNLRPEYLIKEVRNLLRETLPRSIEIQCELPPDLPTVVGDLTQLHQVLLNLGVNARDAMPQGGVLTLSAARVSYTTARITQSGLTLAPGHYVSLCVRDNGEGIKPELMEHIFEPFFTTKPRGAGTGLGLSTVLGIVRGHAGGLEMTSTLGAGTHVCIYLPADGAPPVPAVSPPVSDTLIGANRTILVVDDEEPVRAVIGMALELQGFVHVDAIDGQQALEIFEREPDRFAAVILDQIMPRLGGSELVARLRAQRPNLPIVLVSGLIFEGKADSTLHSPIPAGDLIVLQKPFAKIDLLDALARALG